MRPIPSGVVTFVFTDIEGSTALFHELDEQFLEVLAHHNELLRQTWTAHDGVEVKTEGDAFFVAFADAAAALRAAADGQRVLAAATMPHGRPVRVRMGMHTGTAVVVDNDYVGLDVHQAARVAGAAHGGQVLFTEATLSAAGHLEGLGWHDLGEHRLKDFPTARRLLQLTGDGLDTAFPPPRTSTARSHNLPRPPSPIVGRTAELEAVQRTVVGDARLVTLTASGGLGKTRLALEVGWSVLGWFREGVWFVDLASNGEAAEIPAAVVHAMGLPERGGTSAFELLVERFAGGPALLVLDNLEQLLDDGITVVSDLLAGCPELTVLATSRERLRLRGEHEIVLDGLPRLDAAALFTARALAADASFTGDPTALCEALDGIPLALELAAARVRSHSIDSLLDELANALDLLTEGDRDLPQRHRTMRATVAWSWRLCGTDEQAVMRALAVFAGSPEPQAIEAVYGRDALPVLQQLADRSMVVRRGKRFGVLVPIRAFVAEQLEAAERSRLESAHAQHFCAEAVAAAPELVTAQQVPWLDRLDADAADLHLAVRRNDPRQALQMAGALVGWWIRRGRWAAGRELLADALAAAGPDADATARAQAVAGAAELACKHGEPDTALAYLDKVPGDALSGLLANLRGQALRAKGDLDAADLSYGQARALAAVAGDDRVVAIAASNVAELAYHRGIGIAQANGGLDAESVPLLRQARAAWEEARDASRRTSDDYLTLRVTLNLSGLDVSMGQLDEARADLLAARDLADQLGDLGSRAQADASLGEIAMTLDEDVEAEVRFTSALETAVELGDIAFEGSVLYMWARLVNEDTDYRVNIARCRQSIAIAEKLGDTAEAEQRRTVLTVLMERAEQAQP